MRSSKARGVPRSASSVRAQTTSEESARICRRFEFEAADGQHRLCAIDQADAFLRMQDDGLDAGAAQRFAAGQDCAAELGLAFADQDEGDVGERSQVARTRRRCLATERSE